ncbi:acyl carrier protein [Streptomyces sp. NPDC056254]|uniref:acyl carrier protein n=1 Tax=Streptomyces sp. NPDC056254 TaxID=3345763 RepID=UPI0035DA1A3B
MIKRTPPNSLVSAAEKAIIAEITGMLQNILDGYAFDGTAVEMHTRLTVDLELESIDLVTLAGSLEARYGSSVNFAQFIADMELEEIIDLTVGQLVTRVLQCTSSPQSR